MGKREKERSEGRGRTFANTIEERGDENFAVSKKAELQTRILLHFFE